MNTKLPAEGRPGEGHERVDVAEHRCDSKQGMPRSAGSPAVDLSVDAESGSDYDDMLICTVCDRGFTTPRQLMHHQTQKRHFYCSTCDATFPSAVSLKQHRESQDHWSASEREDSLPDDSSPELQPHHQLRSQSYSEMERLL